MTARPLRRKENDLLLRGHGALAPGPLLGRTVIITRPKAQSRELASLLKDAGASVILAPLIKTVPPASMKGLDRAIHGLPSYHAVVFTSANAVRAFFSRARELGCLPLQEPRRLFAVGDATARELKASGWRSGRVPRSSRAEGLARVMGRVSGQRVLFPRAREGRETLPLLLREAGAKVKVVEAYRTLPDQAGRAVLRAAAAHGADAVVFASPSAVKVFAATLGSGRRKEFFSRSKALSIGPVTSAALRAAGIRPVIEARTPGNASLVRALSAGIKGKA